MSPALVVTDLDGTLLSSGREFSAANLETLARLGRDGVLRVIATGRSWHSAKLALPRSLPLDYLAFSSGAGIVQWASGELIRARDLTACEALSALEVFVELNISCMVHAPVPNNHVFQYWRGTGSVPADFDGRIERYREYATALEEPIAVHKPACQLLGVLPADAYLRFEAVQRRLPQLNVFRTTSPLDHQSLWVEVFPAGVCKADAASWIADRHGVSPRATVAVGNDYNDLDLLDWAQTAFVVGNAPVPLIDRYRVVRSNDASGFSHAVETWEREIQLR